MSVSSPSRGIFLTRVTQHRPLCREHFELTLAVRDFPAASPGQFIQVLCGQPNEVSPGTAMLRRPFSIAGLRRGPSGDEIDILGRVIGPGTAWLDARRPDDVVDILGPLGIAFSIPHEGCSALLVAGGVGLPPLRWLAEILNDNKVFCDAVIGAQSRDLLPLTLRGEPATNGDSVLCVEEFARLGIAACVTTDDGSCGLRGRVTDGLLQRLERIDDPSRLRVYTCGPNPMLKAVAAICAARGIWCEAALERVMGCGMATCQSCVVPIRDESRHEGWRYALCCREGPVFDAARVLW